MFLDMISTFLDAILSTHGYGCQPKNRWFYGFLPTHPFYIILLGFGTIINHPFLGTLIFGNTHIGSFFGIINHFLATLQNQRSFST